ncbi:MAG: DnaD domain protein [Bacilli bacterium]|nr:DnaD domain protein [Bacilli bacterium]
MNKDPAFLFYSSDFLSGVASLTFEERGQYITLMCLQHQHGRLSKKIIDLNVPNISSDVLSKFSVDKNGCFYNKRLEKVIEKRTEFSKKQREKALKRWKKQDTETMPQHKPELYQTDAKIMPFLEDEDDNENININKDIDIDNIVVSVESNFGRPLAPLEIEEINSWDDNDLTRFAIKVAVVNSAKKISYITKTLYDWQKAGIKTVTEAQEYLKKFNKSTQKEEKKKNAFDLIDSL